MAIHYRSQGIIFQKKDVGEADRLFSIYTREFGRLDLLARAERKIKSKLRGGLELFYLSEVEFIQGKIYKTLTDTILIDSYQGLRKSLEKLASVHKISNVLNRLIKIEEMDDNIWHLLLEVFESLDNWQKDKENWKLIYHYFIWNILSLLGYQMELYRCSNCQKKISSGKILFSLGKGGVICQECRDESAKEIKANALKIIRLFLKRDLETIKKLKFEEEDFNSLKEISRRYLSAILRQVD